MLGGLSQTNNINYTMKMRITLYRYKVVYGLHHRCVLECGIANIMCMHAWMSVDVGEDIIV